MKITIIIPTYKPGNYLYECLASLVSQTKVIGRIEVLLILNGPREPYKSEIENYCSSLGEFNIYVHYCTEPDVSSARNYGLDVAKGEYIIFIDDDDIVSENYLVGLLKEASPRGIVFSNVLSFVNEINDAQINYLTDSFNNSHSKRLNWNSNRNHMSLVWGKLIPLSVISNSRFDSRFRNGEDALFMAQISCRIKEYKLTDKDVVYFWRTRKGSASRIKRSIVYELKNTTLLMLTYAKIYLSNPVQYNIIFFITRELAVLKRLFHQIPNSKL